MTHQIVIRIESEIGRHLDQYSWDNSDVVIVQHQLPYTDAVTAPGDV